MNEFPLISVVIPCLNRAHFLMPTIESVLQQDYLHIECIVVDGGSTDDTLEILKCYGKKIKWVSEPDNGHADAINKGWKMSKGDILTWLNADDMWVVPNAASQAVSYLQEHPDVDVMYGECGSIDMDGNVVGMTYFHEWDLEYAVEYCDHCIPQPAAFIRRRILEKVGWLHTTFYQKKDHELWLRIGLVGHIQHVPILLAHERNQQGLSFDGVTAAPACVQVTRKFYSLPNIPLPLQRKRLRAISNAYLRGIDYAFDGGQHWSIIFKYLFKAIMADPSNTIQALRRFKLYLDREAPYNKHVRWTLLILTLFLTPIYIWRRVRMIHNLRPPVPTNVLKRWDIEWSWVASQMPSGPGKILDFRSKGCSLGLLAAQRGFTVTALELETEQWPYVHPQVHFVQGNIFTFPLPIGSFDFIINCSTIAPPDLAKRYNMSEERPDIDLEVMVRLHDLLRPAGIMLLTILIGQDTIVTPMCRVYGIQRLPRLLERYEVEKEVFWIKDEQNCWRLIEKKDALSFETSPGTWEALQPITVLGCFILRK